MYNRTEVKGKAKAMFNLNLVALIAAFAIALILPVILNSIVSFFTQMSLLAGFGGAAEMNAAIDNPEAAGAMALATFFSVFGLQSLLTVAISIFSAIAMLAFQRMTLTAYDGVDVTVSNMLDIKEYWLKLFGLSLWMAVRIFLWSLLLIIPGIIAAYRYAMAPYLMFEDPSKGINQCVDESTAIMKGRKFDLFVLDWSFILWILLIIVTFGLAVFYVGPYMETARAGFYRVVSSEGESSTEQPVTV
ncbi:MAG: DUF975 family protein [Coriobacteriia bacterium]|nr:DUF975 family protein [Coriobacteriia bacterium]